MEPMWIALGSPARGRLTDLALELATRSAGFTRSLPAGVLRPLAALVRSMNCYYSNLIEGHDTHPVDIERALKRDFSGDPHQRDLQKEAVAHVSVQAWMDAGGLQGSVTTTAGIQELHRRFCELLPDELLRVENPETGQPTRVSPGELRRQDVVVGRHVPVSPGALPRFMARFQAAYTGLGRTDAIIAAASAHHRLLWIHPFLDGNGRVARLMSHAMLRETLDTGGVWSIARGLARNDAEYKRHLVACDRAREGDVDGRGALSEQTLAAFSTFFLETCIDQVSFMEGLVRPDRLRERILTWAWEEICARRLPRQSGALLEAILFRGALPRGDVAGLLQTSERHARRVSSALLALEVLEADGPRAPLRLAFPARLATRWLPGLFPHRG
jgi:Fic family protein